MKKITFSILAAFISTVALAQTQDIKGVVTDEAGQPVPFAFLADVQHKYAGYSDSTGMFNITFDPASKITVYASNHKEATFVPNGQKSYNVVLEGKNENGKADTKLNTSVVNTFDSFGTRANAITARGQDISITNHQDATQGSRYLYQQWVHGYVINNADSIVQSAHYLFNYDKIAGSLMIIKDNATVMVIDKSQAKTFVLFDDKAHPRVFELKPEIDAYHYVEVINDGDKYKIFKAIGTKFIKANYSTNGLASTGNNYDEFVDESKYFVVKDKSQPEPLVLKKKAIKQTFATEGDKVNTFISSNGSRDIDDSYLKDLGDKLNSK